MSDGSEEMITASHGAAAAGIQRQFRVC